MRLLIHSDASFLVEWDAKINYGGYFYLGWNQNENEPQKINGAVDVSASLLPLVAISFAEAELGGTFYNAKKGKVLRLTLEEIPFPFLHYKMSPQVRPLQLISQRGGEGIR